MNSWSALNPLARKAFAVRAWSLLLLLLLLLFALSPAQATKAIYTGTTTWTTPAGVTSVQAEVWGGGGGGGGQGTTNQDGGGGGGGGAYSIKAVITVVPGNYTVTVGAGGTGGSGACGTTGGDSWFVNNATVLAKGGVRGCNSTGTPPAGGLGGTAASGVGDTKFSGGNGGRGRNNSTGQGAPGGSSAGTASNGTSGPDPWSTLTAAVAPTGGGIGGNGGGVNVNGFAPASGKGGGGGGSGDRTNGTRVGGAGAGGQVILTYWADQTITFGAQTTPRTYSVGGTFAINPVATTTSPLAITYNTSTTPLVCSVTGTTVTILTAGICTITATQGGDTDWNAATPVSQSVTINPASQTISFTSTAPGSAIVGGATYTPTASATSGLAVTITVDAAASSVCSISGGVVSFTGAGTCVLDANQAGDSSYNAAAQAKQSFAVQPLTALAEYRFDETSGITATDSSVNKLNGSLNGGVTVGGSGSGQVCTGYNFNGSDAFVSVPDTPLLNPTQITVAAWVRHMGSATTTPWETIVAKGDSAYRLHLLGQACNLNSNNNKLGEFTFGVNVGCAGADVSSGIVPVAGTWYHVVGTYDGATIKIYVNGTLQASAAYASTLASNTYPLYIGENAQQTGRYWSGDIDEVKIYGVALSAAQIADGYANESAGKNWDSTARVCAATGPDHLEIQHGTGSGVTCAPSTLTIKACADTLVPCTAYTGGVSGTLSATGSPTVNWVGGSGFSIGSSGSVDKSVQITTPGSVAFGVSSATPMPISATTCKFGASTSCTFTATDAGAFVVAVPSHRSCVAQAPTVTVPAACGVALDGSKSIGFRFAYVNPNTGATPTSHVPYAGLAAPGASLATGSDASFSLTFSSGVATLPYLIYDDAGSLTLTASYAGSGTGAGLSMTGTSTPFVAAPASFVVVSTGPYVAGQSFSAKVTAMNSCATPAATPNFGKESTTETAELKAVTTATASATNSQLFGPSGGVTGSLTPGAFTLPKCSPASAGSVCDTALAWTEVGDLVLSAALKSGSYLGSGFSAWGSAAAGPFKPAFLKTELDTAQPCTSFTYSGQPFRIKVTAMNAVLATTQNYTGSYAKTVTLGSDGASACAPTTSGFSNNSLVAGDFTAAHATTSGAASTAAVTNTTAPLPISYAQALGAPATLSVCANDADGVNSHGQTQASLSIRNGRARMLNAYGSERLDLPVVFRTEYLATLPNNWRINTADICTDATLAFTAVGSTDITNKTCVWDAPATPASGGKACAAATSVTNRQYLEGGVTGTDSSGVAGFAGNFNLWLKAPSTSGAINVTATVPTWLQYPWTSATATNPTARATFGIYKSPLIYRRENY